MSDGSILVWCVRAHTHTHTHTHTHYTQITTDKKWGLGVEEDSQVQSTCQSATAVGTLLTLAVAALPFITCLLEMWT